MGKKTTTKETDCCSFCGSPRSEVGVLFAGSDGACICDQCIERGHSLLEQSKAALDRLYNARDNYEFLLKKGGTVDREPNEAEQKFLDGIPAIRERFIAGRAL